MLAQYMPNKQKKNANILRFTPPGFEHSIDVPFPPRTLPVCERCKKNFKTREHCRTRDCHTGLPWSDTFLCITLDPTCTGEDGKLLAGPFLAKAMQPQPFCLKGEINPLTPICAPCKDKNYTRTYCRSNKKHRQLPWSTVHVCLTLRPDGLYHDNNDRDIQGPTKRRKTTSGTDTAGPLSGGVGDTQGDEKNNEDGDEKEAEETKNKFEDIPPSRTFLCTVSAKRCIIEWLDLDPMLQAAISRKEEHGIHGRMPDDPGFSPLGMNPYNYNYNQMGFPGFPGPTVKSEDPRRGGHHGLPTDQMMNGRFPGGSFGRQDMLGNQANFEGSHMPQRMPYGAFGSPQDMMGLDLNMSRAREMSQGNMPFDGQHATMRGMPWSHFNQSDISQMSFDRMSRGAGQDLMQSQIPPNMWPMANNFMRGGINGGTHGGGNRLDYSGNHLPNNGSNNANEGDMNAYVGGQGYPPHPNVQGGGMMGGGGVGNGDGGGGPPPQRSPQEGEEKS